LIVAEEHHIGCTGYLEKVENQHLSLDQTKVKRTVSQKVSQPPVKPKYGFLVDLAMVTRVEYHN
jgi:hypothetical protein